MRKGHLQRHQSASHFKERPFVCSFEGCSSAFALKHHLTRHEKLHTNPKPFECTWLLCGKSFTKHEQLRLHICLEHTGEALYRCEQCDGMEFKTKSEFKKHEKTVHGSRVYVCGVEGCGQSFNKWSLVVTHRKSEHPKKPTNPTAGLGNILICEECGKGPFKSEASFRQHGRIHLAPFTAPIKHTCPQCEKNFSSRSSLKAHVKAVHSTQLPFVCDDCGKAYGYKKLLKRHIEKIHMAAEVEVATPETLNVSCGADEEIFFKERSLTCPVKECRRRFFRQYDLDRHIQSIHS